MTLQDFITLELFSNIRYIVFELGLLILFIILTVGFYRDFNNGTTHSKSEKDAMLCLASFILAIVMFFLIVSQSFNLYLYEIYGKQNYEQYKIEKTIKEKK